MFELSFKDIYTCDKASYSITFKDEKTALLEITSRNTRITSIKPIYRKDKTWVCTSPIIDFALNFCIEYYYEKYITEQTCEWMCIETETNKKRKINEEIQKVTSQDFELDKVFQVDPYWNTR